jgi:hypothetical protein
LIGFQATVFPFCRSFLEVFMKKIHMVLALVVSLILTSNTAFASHYEQTDSFDGYLDDGYTRSHYVTLYRGYNYKVEANCDRFCSDLDLELYDSRGNLVQYDNSGSDTPSLMFSVNRTGEFRLKVIMNDCYSEPCYYNLKVGER